MGVRTKEGPESFPSTKLDPPQRESDITFSPWQGPQPRSMQDSLVLAMSNQERKGKGWSKVKHANLG